MPIPQQSKLGKALDHLMPKQSKKRTTPLWKGPSVDGITFSLLSRYLSDKERFRIYVVEGLCPQDGWNHRLGYGNMWHICEEAFASEVSHFGEWVGTTLLDDTLADYVRKECKQYPTQQETIDKWYHVCKAQFPAYVKHWQKHPDVKNREPLLQEHAFTVPYLLPSGRLIVLRGKWDSVDIIDGRLWLQENKTKGDVKPLQLQRQLTFDLQTMLYLIALYEQNDTQTADKHLWRDLGSAEEAIAGVRYNVIRRPCSGGKHSIVQHKPSKKEPMGESKEHYYSRLAGLISENSDDFFWRWNVNVTPGDVATFKKQCLDPILENLADDYEWWAYCKDYTKQPVPKGSTCLLAYADVFDGEARRKAFPHHCPRHFRYPFGVYNPIDEAGFSDLDEFLTTGSMIGLRVTETLFPELE